MKWGVRRYQPYPKGERVKGGKEIGEATKVQQRSDTRSLRKTRRELTATTRNSKSRAKDVKAAAKEVKKAEKGYEKAQTRIALPWGQKKKRARIAEAEKNLDTKRASYERTLQKQAQAEDLRTSTRDKLAKQANDYVQKYGSTKIADLKPSQVKLGKNLVVDSFKTGVNWANAPIVGQVVTGKYVSRMEKSRKAEETERRVKKRREQYDY